MHRLRELSEAAARGSFPPPEWGLEVVDPPARLVGAVAAFTGHHVVAATVERRDVVDALDPADVAAPFNPAFLAWLGRTVGGRVGHVDVVLARLGTGMGDEWLSPLPDRPAGERAERAGRLRSEVGYYAPPGGGALLTLGRGLAGRWEISMEVEAEHARGAGLGRKLVDAGVARVPAGEAVFATVAPGNARSLRCVLNAGFAAIGAECLLSAPGADPVIGG